MTKEDIATTIKNYLKYKFAFIKVDNTGNVFINPDRVEEEPSLLRHVPGTTPAYFNTFKQYKGNWYIRK